MALPLSSSGLGPASTDLGLGSALSDQVKTETDEQRKKRMLEQQMQQRMGAAAPALGLGGGSGY